MTEVDDKGDGIALRCPSVRADEDGTRAPCGVEIVWRARRLQKGVLDAHDPSESKSGSYCAALAAAGIAARVVGGQIDLRGTEREPPVSLKSATQARTTCHCT